MKKLQRQEMKNLRGGMNEAGGCSMTFQNANGQWQTEGGSCSESCSGSLLPPRMTCTPFCSTSSFSSPVPLTSNGGVSGCGAQYSYWYNPISF